MHFYTSININYLPKARILAKSVKKYCENVRFSLVLIDKIPKEIDIEQEPFDEIITVEQLDISVPNFKLWLYQHTVVELCTAVKGPALVKFLSEGSDKVVYLDPDIVVFDNMDDLEKLLDKYDIILTPHQTVAEKEKQNIINNEICSLQHGIYNFGFYAVRNNENGMNYAKWWRDRLTDFCYDDIKNGIFTDQRWGDLVPAIFERVYIWKDPGCNVATWNLTNRNITKKNGIYYVNDSKLKFYHFSGFDSGAQKVMLDLYGKNNPYLYELRDWYIQRQYEEEQKKYGMGYGKSEYNYYSNGEMVKKEERIMLRERMDLLEYFKDIDPYIVEQDKSYYNWYQNEMKLLTNNCSKNILETKESKSVNCKLYFDYGNGFSENNAKIVEAKKQNKGEYKIHFDLEFERCPVRMRLDPIEGILCLAIKSEIYVEEKILPSEWSRCVENIKGGVILAAPDPYVIWSLPFSETKIKITGTFIFSIDSEYIQDCMFESLKKLQIKQSIEKYNRKSNRL